MCEYLGVCAWVSNYVIIRVCAGVRGCVAGCVSTWVYVRGCLVL